MPKRPSLDPKKEAGLFQRTEPEQPQEEALDDPVKAYGIGLKISEWGQLEAIAAELGTTRHAVALWALRDFIKRYQAGDIHTRTKKTLPDL